MHWLLDDYLSVFRDATVLLGNIDAEIKMRLKDDARGSSTAESDVSVNVTFDLKSNHQMASPVNKIKSAKFPKQSIIMWKFAVLKNKPLDITYNK